MFARRDDMGMQSLEEEFPASGIEGVVVQMGNVPDAVLHSKRGLIVQEQSYKMPILAAVLVAASLCIWNLPFETPRVLLGNGPTVLHTTALGVVWGAVCVLGGYFFLRRFTQSVTIDPAKGSVVIQSHDYRPEIPLTAVHCIQLCAAKDVGYQANLVFRDAQDRLTRHCLYSHVSYEPCQRLADQYRRLCGFTVVDNTV